MRDRRALRAARSPACRVDTVPDRDSERGEHLRNRVRAVAADRHADAGMRESPSQDVFAVAGTLHPSPHRRPHGISLSVFLKDVLTAQPPRDPSRAEPIARTAELRILVREKPLRRHAPAVRSCYFGDLSVPLQRLQSIFLADLIDRLEDALLDGLHVLRITRQS